MQLEKEQSSFRQEDQRPVHFELELLVRQALTVLVLRKR